MRTPGSDPELALGFLLAEGLIGSLADISANTAAMENSRGESIATQIVQLVSAPREDLQRVSRGLITSSACGLCSRTTLEGLPLEPAQSAPMAGRLSCDLIAALPDRLRRKQEIFSETGGTHGAALLGSDGAVLLVREDVGRHNAVDKLVGAALLGRIALAGKTLVLSGRVSFELMQKAAVAGVAAVVAVGAPSSIAVNLAQTAGITLIGFTRGSRFNVYAHAERIDFGEQESSFAAAMATDRNNPCEQAAHKLIPGVMIVSRLYISPEHVYVGHYGGPPGVAPMVEVERAQLVAGRAYCRRPLFRPTGRPCQGTGDIFAEEPWSRLCQENGHVRARAGCFPAQCPLREKWTCSRWWAPSSKSKAFDSAACSIVHRARGWTRRSPRERWNGWPRGPRAVCARRFSYGRLVANRILKIEFPGPMLGVVLAGGISRRLGRDKVEPNPGRRTSVATPARRTSGGWRR